MTRSEAATAFQGAFGRPPSLVARAPGRVNLIGEHTDYNDGWVMPVALEFATWTALAPRPDRRLRVFAGNKAEEIVIDLDGPNPPRPRHWSTYVIGMAVELEREGNRLRGADVWLGGDVPEGAGLSSSAALEMSLGLALLVHAGQPVDRLKLALAGQRVEHDFAGTRCGIMDEFISVHGKAHHALMLDCRSLAYRLLPLPETLQLVICDSGVRHELAEGEYNVRRAQCEEGVRFLKQVFPGIRALRDITSEELARHGPSLPAVVRRRCQHVVSENRRVEAFAAALQDGDLPALGRLMAASHASLRDDYEVSCRELDVLVDLARTAPGAVGSRMTGGGFGGSTVNVVLAPRVDEFQHAVRNGYQRVTGQSFHLFASAAGDGAAIIAP